MKTALLLIGHGSPAADTPRELLRELKSLEEERQRKRLPEMTSEERDLDHKIRSWPRTAENDPYRQGLEAIGASLAKRLPAWSVALAYNEFCVPSIDEAVDRLVQDGHGKIVFVTTMFTRGGVHAECEIPWELQRSQRRHPNIEFTYAWPFDTERVSDLLARQARALA
jgi:sirohydrochlorin cobaltochelatase